MADRKKNKTKRNQGGLVTQYFLCVLLLFGILSLGLNLRLSKEMGSAYHLGNVRNYLMEAFTSGKIPKIGKPAGTRPMVGEQASAALGSEDETHTLAGLKCDKYGGPADASEMVYWEDIPTDNAHVSPFKRTDGVPQYLTFEPDHGGWNNIRMAMETVLALAFASGRTLVLPPETEMYLLGKQQGKVGTQRKEFSFNHFFHMESIHNEHRGLDIITTKQFLEREAMTGNLRDQQGRVVFPPMNRTDWDGARGADRDQLVQWLRRTSHMAVWVPEKCLAAFPASTDPADTQALIDIKNTVEKEGGFPTFEAYVGKPFPVNAPAKERMMENWAGRNTLCIYDDEMQKSQLVHFPVDNKLGARLLVHSYAMLFFQDWRHDLWMKRFIRDHVRYVDEIQCAAARVVQAVRERARSRQPNSTKGEFDSFHIRRGDFQYTVTRFDAPKIYEMSKSKLIPGGTVYIATDERDKDFFQPLKDHYDVVFLDDFHDALGHINTNYYGMIDQLVASRGRTFFGCWFSTFTGYINRIRGYHANREMAAGYEQGIVNSWYYALEDRFDHMQTYYPVKQSFYAREFPTSWRLIDTGIGEMKELIEQQQQ